MDLLELDKHLENSLKVGDVIQMRAGDKNDAIRLVTKDKSYDVQRIPYSNVLLVSDTINKEELQSTANQPENLELLGIEDLNESIDLDLSIDENLDTSLDENIAKKNFPIILRKFCHGAASQYLTVKHARPSVKKMFETIPFYPESISFENLANQIRCSDKELDNLINKFDLVVMTTETGISNIKLRKITKIEPIEEIMQLNALLNFAHTNGWQDNQFGFSIEEYFASKEDIDLNENEWVVGRRSEAERS